MTELSPRPITPIDELSNAWVDKLAELSPILATYIGYPQRQDQYDDFSPSGVAAANDAAKETLRQLLALEPIDEVDVVSKRDLAEELQLNIETFEAGAHFRDLNVLASPAQDIRQVYDLMPSETEADWQTISTRLSNIDQALSGYIATLSEGIARGIVPAKRQVVKVAAQVHEYAKADGIFAELIARANPEFNAALLEELNVHAQAAAGAYGKLEAFLNDTLLEHASEEDAVGREIYALASRRFLGAKIDLDETYEWGIQELARMASEQEAIAEQIKPGASIAEAITYLAAEGKHTLNGTDALQRWMQEKSDQAIEELGRSHFDIAAPIRDLECMIAPTNEGGIYYTGPTDDFSRPGRMWWSVPEGITTFDTWRELTTVYHEGVPGHHLQIAQAVYNRAELNNYRRLLAGSSGHAEGWALYAERLMDNLGYLTDPADRLGMLDAQRMRAARVVLDIGVHLGKPRLDGTGVWDYEYALEFFRSHVNMNDEFVVFEVNRYFGWPGQAPSYKVGQRLWENIRDELKARQGA
ncbi:MAG: DUF885 domain-containing protein, partial [Microbacteriaceae bacterium]